MRKIKALNTILLLIVLSGFYTPALAQDDAEIRAAIAGAMAALDEFMTTFNARDMRAWAGTLNYPHVRFASGEVTIWQTADEFIANSRTFEALPRQGWDHSHWLSREVMLAAPDKVHVNTVFQRFNSNNEPIGTYESLYIVTNVNGHWGTQARSSLAP